MTKKKFFSKTYKFSDRGTASERPDPNLPTTKTEAGEPPLSPENIAKGEDGQGFPPDEIMKRNPS